MTKSKFVWLAPVLAVLAGAALQGCGNSGATSGTVGTGGSVGVGGSVGTGGSVGAGGNGGSAPHTPKVTIVGSGS
jgi:hypothetical protein